MRFMLPFLLVLGQAATASSQPIPTVQSPAIDLDLAKTYFAEARRLAEADGGKLWGKSLAGPLLFVEPRTRYAVAIQADAEKKLKPVGGVFVRERCTKTVADRSIVVERSLFRKPEQDIKSFVDETRMTILLTKG